MKEGKPLRVHVITMGCAKNVVDSEKLMAQLRLNAIEIAPTIENADIAVVNTCGFIDAAKQESIDAIIEQVKRKGKGKLQKVFAMGCLSERYGTELHSEIPEVDGFFGTNDTRPVLRALGAELKTSLLGERILSTPPHTAYLKISEGCDNPCSFCAIPLMRGRHASRPQEEILREAEWLALRGVREIVVIAQDSTSYGLDIDGRRQIGTLLTRLADVPGIAWVRLMYAYPAQFPHELLEVMASHPRICKYLDIPVQHVSDDVLRSMRRGISRRALVSLIEQIRVKVPGIALRTTLMVGYPAETENAFAELESFVRESRFDRLGVFAYSREEGTSAFALGDPVPESEKERRRSAIMEAQREISLARNEALVGSRVKVLIDRVEGEFRVGRTEHDAPEIDNEVFVRSDRALDLGSFCDVDIHDATEYDLYGRA
ncbi:MAG TPA: 30S ribosomal protein S12 methylthiotransferase RimO [Bacteroidota bacterium]|nr:30S ribosomal protein S12 methylthiotransferase RimO [Bacteroidota bacterium]